MKMEFNRLRTIMQLVVERESLKLAALNIQKEVFEQSQYDLIGAESGVTPSRPQYRYRLRFDHIDGGAVKSEPDPQPSVQSPESKPTVAKIKDGQSQGLKLKLTLTRPPPEQARSSSSSTAAGAQASDEQETKKRRTLGAGIKKRKSKADESGDAHVGPTAGSAEGSKTATSEPAPSKKSLAAAAAAAASAAAAAAASEAAAEEAAEPLEPEYNPLWPNFLNELKGRNPVSHLVILSKVVRTNLTQLTLSAQMFIPETWSDYLEDLEVDVEEEGPPLKYGCRGRVGRGGRLVIDRYPVRTLPYLEHQSCNLVICLFETGLSSPAGIGRGRRLLRRRLYTQGIQICGIRE